MISRLAHLPNNITEIRNISVPFSSTVSVVLMAIGCYALIRSNHAEVAWLLMSIVGIGLLFAVYARPDWTSLGHYFAPYIPCGFVLLVFGISAVAESISFSETVKSSIFAGASLAIIVAGVSDVSLLFPKTQDEYPWYVANSHNLVPAAKWIEKNTPTDSCIATRRIGCLAFYGKRTVFDYSFGLTDRNVAQLISEHGGNFKSPQDKLLADIWDRKSPDYIIEDSHVIKSFCAGTNGMSFAVHGMLYSPIKSFRINNSVDWVLCQRQPVE
jgi:hypothetical protein